MKFLYLFKLDTYIVCVFSSVRVDRTRGAGIKANRAERKNVERGMIVRVKDPQRRKFSRAPPRAQ